MKKLFYLKDNGTKHFPDDFHLDLNLAATGNDDVTPTHWYAPVET